MLKRLLLIGVIIFLIILVAASIYTIKKPDQKNDGVENTVSWNEAIRILNSGEVEQVLQTHSLEVTLILKDGTRIKTKEPNVDDILDEVEKCGSRCENIFLATE